MKKVVAIFMVMVMVFAMALPAVAATDSFTKSPSGNPAPEVEKVEPADKDCTVEIIITPYVDRNDLDTESRSEIEKAYDTIKNNKEDSSLKKALKKLETKEHPIDALAISDLFDLDYSDCDGHADHGSVQIHLSAETLDHFVGLLVYVGGEWMLVEGAEVDKEESNLKFLAEKFGPYAIVVDSTQAGGGAATGDTGISWIWFVLMGVSAAGLITIAVVYRKSLVNMNA